MNILLYGCNMCDEKNYSYYNLFTVILYCYNVLNINRDFFYEDASKKIAEESQNWKFLISQISDAVLYIPGFIKKVLQ